LDASEARKQRAPRGCQRKNPCAADPQARIRYRFTAAAHTRSGQKPFKPVGQKLFQRTETINVGTNLGRREPSHSSRPVNLPGWGGGRCRLCRWHARALPRPGGSRLPCRGNPPPGRRSEILKSRWRQPSNDRENLVHVLNCSERPSPHPPPHSLVNFSTHLPRHPQRKSPRCNRGEVPNDAAATVSFFSTDQDRPSRSSDGAKPTPPPCDNELTANGPSQTG